MKNHQEQIMKALSGLVSEEAQTEVSAAVASFLDEAVNEIEAVAAAKQEERDAEWQAKLDEAQKTGYEGYAQAWDMVLDLRERLEIQKEEFDAALDEGYEEAFKMIQDEKQKASVLENDLYEEYERKLHQIKEFMVDKLDVFLSHQGDKYYEMAKRDLLNDPTLAEHKLAFDRILEVAADYLSDEDYAYATSSKIDALAKDLDEAKATLRLMEGKNTRLRIENTRLNETVRKAQENLVTESVTADVKERVQKAKKAEGRGDVAPAGRKKVEVIAEAQDVREAVVAETTKSTDFLKGLDAEIAYWESASFKQDQE